MPACDHPALEYVRHPSLTPLWAAVRRRLEGNRLQVAGSVTVTLDPDGADRLAGLLAAAAPSQSGRSRQRPTGAGPTRVALTDLDRALRGSAIGDGLVTVTAAVTGPLTDRVAAREKSAQGWDQVWAALDAGLTAAVPTGADWWPVFGAGVRRAGLLTRAGPDAARAAVGEACAVLARLAQDGALPAGVAAPRWELAALAGSATGDAHALDDGRLTAALVLRALAAASGRTPPVTATGRRELWALAGVVHDEVSGTVLGWNLRPPGDDAWSRMMRARADLGVVTHLTLQELRGPAAASALARPGERVHACENPQVVQAAARAGSPGTLVCVSGNPAAAGWLLLTRLIADGAQVRYHGDFDWYGVAILARLADALGVEPWRMTAADYQAAVRAQPPSRRLRLTGTPGPTPWDDELATQLARTGAAVHEEELIDVLLADLNHP